MNQLERIAAIVEENGGPDESLRSKLFRAASAGFEHAVEMAILANAAKWPHAVMREDVRPLSDDEVPFHVAEIKRREL